MRSRKRFALATAAAAAVAVATPAAAEPVPASGLEGIGKPVSDAALGDMRGKFISPQNISYFGVQMQTSWQGPDGVTTHATLLFSVDFLNGAGNPDGATPVLMIGWTREGDPSMDVAGFGGDAAGDYIALPIGGLGTVQGAVQSQQIAGSDNIVRNDMRIAVVPASAIQAPDGSGLTLVTAGQNHQFADGDTVQFILDGNALGLALTDGATSDQVRQGFDGMLGQAAQHVLINSSNNAIHNGMGIVVGYDQLNEAGRVSLQNALSTLQGIGL